MNEAWGPYSIDKFADNYSTQLTRFACPGTEAVDTFTEHLWVMEKITGSALHPVLEHGWCVMQRLVHRVNSTLVVPLGVSTFLALVVPEACSFCGGIRDVAGGEVSTGSSGGHPARNIISVLN